MVVERSSLLRLVFAATKSSSLQVVLERSNVLLLLLDYSTPSSSVGMTTPEEGQTRLIYRHPTFRGQRVSNNDRRLSRSDSHTTKKKRQLLTRPLKKRQLLTCPLKRANNIHHYHSLQARWEERNEPTPP